MSNRGYGADSALRLTDHCYRRWTPSARCPLRHMSRPAAQHVGGHQQLRATGWITDRSGYRYSRSIHSAVALAGLPPVFADLAEAAAQEPVFSISKPLLLDHRYIPAPRCHCIRTKTKRLRCTDHFAVAGLAGNVSVWRFRSGDRASGSSVARRHGLLGRCRSLRFTVFYTDQARAASAAR